jgi:hypothetical protein
MSNFSESDLKKRTTLNEKIRRYPIFQQKEVQMERIAKFNSRQHKNILFFS